MREMPTGSTWDRAERCPASHVLQRIIDGDGSHWSERGDVIHEFSANLTTMSREEAMKLVGDDWRETLDGIDFGVDLKGFAAEVTFVIDLQSGAVREVCRGKRPAHVELGPFETRLTVDIVGVEGKKRVVVLDWKTGFKAVRSAKENLQIGLGAYAASQLYGCSEALVGIGYVKEGQVPHFDWAELDQFDLSDILERCRATFMGISNMRATFLAGQPVDVTTGSWCHHCPAFQSCPSQTAMVRAAFAMPNATADDIKALLTPENVAKAYEKLQILKQAVSHVNNAIHAYATEHPIDLGNGKIYGLTPSGREVISDQGKAREVLARHCSSAGDLDALNTADWKTSKAQVARIFGKEKADEYIKEMRREGVFESRPEVREHTKK